MQQPESDLGAKLTKDQQRRLEEIRAESFHDVASKAVIIAVYSLFIGLAGLGILFISREIGSYIPAVIALVVSSFVLLLFSLNPRRYQRIAAASINYGLMIFYFAVTVYYERVDLVMFWFFAHMVVALFAGGAKRGGLTIAYFTILLYAGLFYISPDIQITRNANFVVIGGVPLVLLLGFMILSELQLDSSFYKILKERDAAKITTTRLNVVLKHTGMGIIDVTSSKTVEFSNNLAQSLLGHTSSIVGKNLDSLASFKDEAGEALTSTSNQIFAAIDNNQSIQNYRTTIVESNKLVDVDVVNVDGGGSVVIIKPLTVDEIEDDNKSNEEGIDEAA